MSGAPIDLRVERTIAATPERVAAVMFDPAQDPTWMHALTRAEPLDPVITTGARVRRYARFLGRTISWITVVREYDPPRRLVLDIAEGPFTGEVVYEIEPAGDGARVTIRNVGRPGQFAWVPAPLTRAAMRSALRKDLAHLEQVVTA
jgi:uncharacterized protein YndB with AHSA1/START domain